MRARIRVRACSVSMTLPKLCQQNQIRYECSAVKVCVCVCVASVVKFGKRLRLFKTTIRSSRFLENLSYCNCRHTYPSTWDSKGLHASVCVCVCVCVCVHTYMFIYYSTDIDICIGIYVYIYMCVCVCSFPRRSYMFKPS